MSVGADRQQKELLLYADTTPQEGSLPVTALPEAIAPQATQYTAAEEDPPLSLQNVHQSGNGLWRAVTSGSQSKEGTSRGGDSGSRQVTDPGIQAGSARLQAEEEDASLGAVEALDRPPIDPSWNVSASEAAQPAPSAPMHLQQSQNPPQDAVLGHQELSSEPYPEQPVANSRPERGQAQSQASQSQLEVSPPAATMQPGAPSQEERSPLEADETRDATLQRRQEQPSASGDQQGLASASDVAAPRLLSNGGGAATPEEGQGASKPEGSKQDGERLVPISFIDRNPTSRGDIQQEAAELPQFFPVPAPQDAAAPLARQAALGAHWQHFDVASLQASLTSHGLGNPVQLGYPFTQNSWLSNPVISPAVVDHLAREPPRSAPHHSQPSGLSSSTQQYLQPGVFHPISLPLTGTPQPLPALTPLQPPCFFPITSSQQQSQPSAPSGSTLYQKMRHTGGLAEILAKVGQPVQSAAPTEPPESLPGPSEAAASAQETLPDPAPGPAQIDAEPPPGERILVPLDPVQKADPAASQVEEMPTDGAAHKQPMPEPAAPGQAGLAAHATGGPLPGSEAHAPEVGFKRKADGTLQSDAALARVETSTSSRDGLPAAEVSSAAEELTPHTETVPGGQVEPKPAKSRPCHSL